MEVSVNFMRVDDYGHDGSKELVVDAALTNGEAAAFLFALEGAALGEMRRVK